MVRLPESEVIMEDADSVAEFAGAGLPGGPLSAIYHFSCLAFSRLLPSGGTVVDLGCGPGQFLKRLLQLRPDLKGVGVDLSAPMLTLAAESMQTCGIGSRVQFVQADFAAIDSLLPDTAAGVTCISALHHLADMTALVDALTSIRRLRDRTRCAVWLFDVVRPEQSEYCELIPRTHEVAAGIRLRESFRRDWVNSLRAGWTFAELQAALNSAQLPLAGAEANFSQLHWAGEIQHPGCATRDESVEPGDVSRAEQLASALGWCSPASPPRCQ